MAEEFVIKNIQFKRGDKDRLEARLIAGDLGIPAEGEPIFERDTGKLKIGDGVLDYAHLPYLAGGGSDERFIIVDPLDGQILLYDHTAAEGEGAWVNKDLADTRTLTYLANRGLSIKGFDQAPQGYIPAKDTQNGIVWVKPVDTKALNDAVAAAQQARNDAQTASSEASTSAQAAETAKDQAEIINQQTMRHVNEKFWWGTLAEYNAWIAEHGINPGTFYFITATQNTGE